MHPRNVVVSEIYRQFVCVFLPPWRMRAFPTARGGKLDVRHNNPTLHVVVIVIYLYK